MYFAILNAAVIFDLGHLPTTLACTPFPIVVLAREILLNGIYGTLFGYLYWKRGLEFSAMAHFNSDLPIHVIMPTML